MLARPLKENFAAVSFVAATDFCCAAALLHLAWASCTAALSHRAWAISCDSRAMDKLVCDVCSLGAHETSWCRYKVDRGTLAPDLSICRDCYDGLAHGFQPEKAFKLQRGRSCIACRCGSTSPRPRLVLQVAKGRRTRCQRRVRELRGGVAGDSRESGDDLGGQV